MKEKLIEAGEFTWFVIKVIGKRIKIMCFNEEQEALEEKKGIVVIFPATTYRNMVLLLNQLAAKYQVRFTQIAFINLLIDQLLSNYVLREENAVDSLNKIEQAHPIDFTFHAPAEGVVERVTSKNHIKQLRLNIKKKHQRDLKLMSDNLREEHHLLLSVPDLVSGAVQVFFQEKQNRQKTLEKILLEYYAKMEEREKREKERLLQEQKGHHYGYNLDVDDEEVL